MSIIQKDKAKPFIKWVGGKRQLINQLDNLLPYEFRKWKEVTYIEPFVGGGAMLFHMLQTYPNINKAVINDINTDLINCYNIVRDNPIELINRLSAIEKEYLLMNEVDRKQYYLHIRAKYNQRGQDNVERSSMFIFLNRTCFNGLYRVNRSGEFNVPFGRYVSPKICDTETILADSELLQRVTILNGDFEATIQEAEGSTFFYMDPPYRPISNTSSFVDYTKDSFNDSAQIRLKQYCDLIDKKGYAIMLSNSDDQSEGEGNGFFDKLYCNYDIQRVLATRSVNANPSKRGQLSEIVIRNYDNQRYTIIPNIVSFDNTEYIGISEEESAYGKRF